MKKKKFFGNFLRDPQTDILWLHNNRSTKDYHVWTANGILDLSLCKQEKNEIVGMIHFGNLGFHYSFIAKNKEGRYAVMFIYEDSMGYGAIYASITPGFTFLSVYGFEYNHEVFIVVENLEKKWGVIRISFANSCWVKPDAPMFIPQEIVRFNCESINEAINNLSANISNKGNDYLSHVITLKEFHEQPQQTACLVDLTVDGEDMMYDEDWGVSIDEIKKSCQLAQ